MIPDRSLTLETVDLLQALIRNGCVNDGRDESGEEVRNADLLLAQLEGTGADIEVFEPFPGRRSVLARVAGSDPSAPSLGLVGHTDVVPANPDQWRRDPFAGELVDGEVWGRGAIDMLNLTAAMAVAFRHLARTGFRPRGDLLFLGVADEEAGGTWGADWLCEHAWDAVGCDYVLTEAGGLLTHVTESPRLLFGSAEKGAAWRRIRVRGTAAHGSAPYGTDNAVLKAAEVIRRLHDAPPRTAITGPWRALAEVLDAPAHVREALLDPERVDTVLGELEPVVARTAHALTRLTVSPNVVHGGQKTNTIPDVVEIDVDMRTLPGQEVAEADALLREALGDLADHVEVEPIGVDRPASSSPTDTPLWATMVELAQRAHPDVAVLPELTSGGTDATFFRARGAVAYGAGLFSRRATMEDFADRFHGPDERVDVDSLGLSAEFFVEVARRTLA